MRTSRSVASFLFLCALTAGPPAFGRPHWLTVDISHRDGRSFHEYTVEDFGDPNYSRIFRLAVEIRGPRPVEVRSPQDWVATVEPARSPLWGCRWRIEWKLKGDPEGATPPASGFSLAFPDALPKSWCFGELDGNGMDMATTGPDAEPSGVP
jgi:hypothetical protein